MTTPNTWIWHEAPWHDDPKVLLQLEIKYEDGSTETIVSDGPGGRQKVRRASIPFTKGSDTTPVSFKTAGPRLDSMTRGGITPLKWNLLPVNCAPSSMNRLK